MRQLTSIASATLQLIVVLAFFAAIAILVVFLGEPLGYDTFGVMHYLYGLIIMIIGAVSANTISQTAAQKQGNHRLDEMLKLLEKIEKNTRQNK